MKKKSKNKKAGGGLVVRIPEDMVEALKKNAENEYRTIEQQVLWTLKRGIEWSPVTTVTLDPWTTTPSIVTQNYRDPTRNWDGSPRLTYATGGEA